MQNKKSNRGFTMIELVVVISVLAILSGVLVPRVTNHMKAARDGRRLADIKTLRNAVEQYQMDKGVFPTARANSSYGSWDVSHDTDFIATLQEAGYLEGVIADPINNGTFHYRYFVYEKGAYGCEGDSEFYVLGIRNFESTGFAERNRGLFRCSGRNWANEFAYVTGGGSGSTH